MNSRILALLPAVLLASLGACSSDDATNDPIVTPAKKGALAGAIKSVAGLSLENAVVTTVPASTTAKSDASGKYSIADLEAGTYTVVVTLDGWLKKERAGIVVGEGASVTLDFALDPATGGAKLTVNDGCGTGGLAGAVVSRTGAGDTTTGTTGDASLEGLAPGKYTLQVDAPGYLPTSIDVTIEAGKTATASVALDCQTHAAGEVARTWLATVATTSPITTATSLYDKLNDADTTNDPKILDMRTATDFAAGHVPGALNVPYKTAADEATLTLLGDPAGAKLAGYCYTGHTGGMASAVLNMLGYQTANMKYGIVAWTRDTTARTASGTAPDVTKNFTLETTAHTLPSTNTLPVLSFSGVKTGREVIKLAARAYLNDPTMKPVITAQELFDNLNDGNTANDPIIISVRKPEDYAKGHIPGAINIPWDKVALEANLKMLPTDRDIVVYCYTGHTGAVAHAVLGTLGYHKVRNLKWGMMGWTQDATARVQAPFNDASDSHDFPIKTGTSP